MRDRLLLAIVSLSLVACPKPRQDTKKPQTKASAAQATTSPATNAANKPTQDPTPAKPTARNGAIFWVSAGKDNLVALACFDADAKTFGEEDDCLSWLPKERLVRAESGEGMLAPVAQPCASGKAFSGASGSFAFWPLEAKPVVLPFESIEVKKLSDAEKKAIAKEVKAQTKDKHEISFVSALDLNNDGKKDRIYGVLAKTASSETGASFSFSGLFFSDGNKPSAVSLLTSSMNERFLFHGGVDLDQDNKAELWLEKILVEDNIEVSRQYSLEKIIDGALEEIAAREACLL